MNKQQNEEKNTPDVFKSLLEELNQAGYKLSGNIVVNIYRSGSQHVDRVENQYIGIRPTKAATKSKAAAPKNAPKAKPTTTAKPTAPKAMPTTTAKPTAKSKAAAPKNAPKAMPTTTAKSATTTTTAKPTAPKAMPTATPKPAATSKATAKPKPTAAKSASKPTPTPNRPTPPNPAAQLVPLPDNLRSLLRECLALLMQERFGSEPLLNRQSHWQAVYRILVDKGYCADSDFNGFDSFIRGVMPEVVNKPYTKGSVKMISQTPFVRPFGEWKFDPLIFKTRKPFERMVAVASRFLTLMDEHGLVKKRPNS